MSLIRPFPALRPQSEHTAAVIAPPYDVLNTHEARQRAAGRPWSFLHISRAEIDLPEGTDQFSPIVYTKAAENMKAMLRKGILKQDNEACYYLYQLVMGEHKQTGLVAAASVDAYDGNRIRRHEFTRPDKEDDRVRQIDVLNAQTGPVLLAYKHHQALAERFARICAAAPEVDEKADDGIIHRIWVVQEAQDLNYISEHVNAMSALYIADGHHRSAAASRVAEKRRAGNPAHNGEEAYNYFLAVLFSDAEMQILDYNRAVTDLNDLDTETFLQRVRENFSIQPEEQAVRPAQPGEFGMYLEGKWYRLNIHAHCIPKDNPVRRLDVSLLADKLIAPVLGIDDPRRDKRIDFIGGIRGLGELEKRVDGGGMKAAFSLFPTRMSDLMAVADAGDVMPPKSTWFEPKLADGLISHVLEGFGAE